MKKFFILITTLLFSLTILAQPNKKDRLVRGNDKVYAKINAYSDSLFHYTSCLKRCASGFMFVNFTVGKNGKITRVQTNEGTPGFLDTIFKQAIKRTNGLWKTKANKSYILPVIYNLHFNCSIDTNSKKMGPLESILKTIPNSTEPNKDGHIYSFMNMTNFKKTKGMAIPKYNLPLNCFLMTPFELVTPFHELQQK